MRHLDEGQLQAWLDRDRSGLSPETLEAIREHLAACTDCAARLEVLRTDDAAVRDLLQELGGEAGERVPDFATIRARAKEIAEEGAEGEGEAGADGHPGAASAAATASRRWRPGAWAWAASVVVALGTGWLWNEMSRENPSAGLQFTADREVVAEGAASPEAEGAPVPDATRAARAETERGDGAMETSPRDVAAPGTPEIEAPQAALSGEPAPAREAPGAGVAGRIAGRITDTAGVPLAGAQVVVAGTDRGTLTDARGDFVVEVSGSEALSRDTLDLRVALMGYREETVKLATGENPTPSPAEIRLEPAEVELAELTVAATPPAGTVTANAARARAATPVPSWQEATLEEARERLGFEPRSVPGLPVTSVALGTADIGLPAVRIVQRLAGGGELVLIQAMADQAAESAVAGDVAPSDLDRHGLSQGPGTLAVTLPGGILVNARAPLSADSLRVLLDRLQEGVREDGRRD